MHHYSSYNQDMPQTWLNDSLTVFKQDFMKGVLSRGLCMMNDAIIAAILD